jgi:hypothetical protein
MGADLYIKSITEPAREKYEPLFNAACERRNALQAELRQLNEFAGVFKQVGQNLESIKRVASDAQNKIKALEERISAEQNMVDTFLDKMNGNGGYFRDSYNGTCVLARLGLSWWQDVKSMYPTRDELVALVKKIKSSKLRPVTLDDLRENHCRVDAENTVAMWGKYFQNKKRRLVRFLERAIREHNGKESIYFSL